MKKKLVFTIFLLCFSLSLYTLSIFNSRLWGRINTVFESNRIVMIITYSPDYEREDIIETIEVNVQKYQVNLKTAFFSNGINTTYLLLSDQKQVFKNVPLISDKPYDFSNPDNDQYFSNDIHDTKSSGYLYSVYPLSTSKIEYRTFYDIVHKQGQLYGWYSVQAPDRSVALSFAEEIKARFPNSVVITQPSFDNEPNEKLRNEILIISFMLLLLLLLIEVSKNMKEISIRKSMGENFISISKDLFSPFLMTTILSAILAFILSYIVLIKTLNQYTVDYMFMLASQFLIIIGLTCLLFILLGGIIFMISPISIIKNKNINKQLFEFNFILKIVFVILLFPQLLIYMDTAIDTSDKLMSFIAYKDVLASNVSQIAMNPNANILYDQDLLNEFSKKYKQYALENSDFFLEYHTYNQNMPENVAHNPESKEYVNYVYFTMNREYFTYYPINYDLSGYLEKEKPFILVNETTLKTSKVPLNKICKDCEIVVIKSKYKVLNFEVLYKAFYDSPVMVIYPDLSSLPSLYLGSGFFYYHENSSIEAEKRMQSLTNHFDGNWVFSNNSDKIRHYMTYLSLESYYAIVILIQCLAAIMLIIMHGITVLYDLEKREIAIHYFSGYSFLQRSSYIVLQDALLFGLLWFYLWTKDYGLVKSFGYAFIVLCINFVFASLHLLRNEKKQAIDAIKNS